MAFQDDAAQFFHRAFYHGHRIPWARRWGVGCASLGFRYDVVDTRHAEGTIGVSDGVIVDFHYRERKFLWSTSISMLRV